MSVLGVYQRAYSNHEVPTLEGILSPGVKRHGLAAGGCSVTQGRGEVIRNYESQFEEGTGTYELTGLAPGQIQVTSRIRAYVNTHYQISPGGAGYVNFHFAELNGAWKISEIYATCE